MQSLNISTLSSTGVKVFKGSINDMESKINSWVAENQVRITSTSMTYDEGAGFGMVFVLVSFSSER